jgi:hypothetical protein
MAGSPPSAAWSRAGGPIWGQDRSGEWTDGAFPVLDPRAYSVSPFTTHLVASVSDRQISRLSRARVPAVMWLEFRAVQSPGN